MEYLAIMALEEKEGSVKSHGAPRPKKRQFRSPVVHLI
jgi:hypothetical protein